MEGISLEPAPILSDAADLAGLDDFGSESFQEPLECLCAALDGEASLPEEGIARDFSEPRGRYILSR